MTLTLDHGPLAKKPPPKVNYEIDGPEHRLLFGEFPRRVRGLFGGEIVLDSDRGRLLHETGYLPQLYVPEEDLRLELLEPTEHQTRCPFKGEASYWSLRAGDRRADNAVWSYRDPTPRATWLRDFYAFQFEVLDAWFDEDEEIEGHLRDPYHRVDVRRSSRHVRVTANGSAVAETDRPMVLSETGLPNRYYIPPDDVRRDVLEPSATHTICPYKGTASYHAIHVGDAVIQDAAWSYPEPLENAFKVEGYLCFSHQEVQVEVDGARVV